MKKLTLLFLLLLFNQMVNAQDIYIVNELNELKIVDTQDFSITNLFTVDIPSAGFISDLAFSPLGKLYGVTGNKTLIEIDLVNEDFQIIEQLPTGNNYPGLVANANNELITATFSGGNLYVHDIDTGETNVVASGLSTPGDFTFYKGNLIFPSVLDDDVKAYDGNEIKTVGCSGPDVFAFVNVFTACNENVVYGIDEDSKVFLYDMESTDNVEVADLLSEVGIIFGAATMSEYMASDCPLEDLVEVEDCTLGVNDLRFSDFIIIENPVENLLKFETSKNIDHAQYNIFDMQGSIVLTGTFNAEQIEVSGLQSGVYFLKVNSINVVPQNIQKFIKL